MHMNLYDKKSERKEKLKHIIGLSSLQLNTTLTLAFEGESSSLDS